MAGNGTEKAALNLLKLVVSIGIPLAGVTAAVVGTRYAIQVQLDRHESGLERSAERHIELQNTFRSLEARFSAHVDFDGDGIFHPAGVFRELKRLDDRVKALEAK